MRRGTHIFVLLAVLLGTAGRVHAQEPAPATPAEGEPVQDVVVHGERAGPRVPARDRSVAGSVVRGERLRAPGLQVADVLRAEPGVAIVQTGGHGSLATASLRGATSAQTPVYLAGVRLNDDVAGTADLSLVPLWLLERIEVYRGNAPLDADDLGIGGAIFFEPVRPKEDRAGAGGLAGSFGTLGAWAYGAAGGPQSAALLGARWETASNTYRYLDDRGTGLDSTDDVERVRSNADVTTYDVWALGRTELGADSSVELVVNGVQREQGLPGLALLPTRMARASMQRALYSVATRTPCDSEGRCMLRLSTSALLASTSLDDPLAELSLQTDRVDSMGRRIEQMAQARVDVTEQLTLTPSVRLAVETLGIESPGERLGARRLYGRAAIGGDYRLARQVTARVVASAACHGTSSAGAGEACDQATPAGRVGLEVGGPQLAVLANLGRYVRVPTLGELYGTAGVVRGNSELVPESGVTLDAGVRAMTSPGAMPRLYGDLFAFVRQAQDLVAYRRSSLGFVRPYNVQAARVAGVEATAGAGVTSFLTAEVNATLLDPRDTSEERTEANDILPYRSRLTLAPRLRFDFDNIEGATVERVAIDVQWLLQSSRYADPAGLVVIPAQRSLDIDLLVEIMRRRLALRGRLSNALDEGRFDAIGYPLPGRAVYGAAEVRW